MTQNKFFCSLLLQLFLQSLNGFRYCNLTPQTVFNINHLFACREGVIKLLFNINYSIQHYSFVCTQLNVSKIKPWPIKWNVVSFQAAVVPILLYGCTTWTLTKRLEKKLDGNYTRMFTSKYWISPGGNTTPQKHPLYGHLPPHHEKLSKLRLNQTRRTLLEKQRPAS